LLEPIPFKQVKMAIMIAPEMFFETPEEYKGAIWLATLLGDPPPFPATQLSLMLKRETTFNGLKYNVAHNIWKTDQ